MNSNSSPSTDASPVSKPGPAGTATKPRRGVRKLAKRGFFASCFLVAGTTGLGTWKLRSSLPTLAGKQTTEHVQHKVRIDRDGMGIPSIHAENRLDASYALGFVHAQDRFFQMDLLRRVPAGRLSELVGKSALGADKRFRKHRFSSMAQQVFDRLPQDQKELAEAYSRGVNEGLRSLSDEPFEYQVLQKVPESWKPTDSFLVMMTMLCDLQPMDGTPELGLTLLKERVPEEVFQYLVRRGSRWDAALDDTMIPAPSIPGAEVWSMRRKADGNTLSQTEAPKPIDLAREDGIWDRILRPELMDWEFRVGSNNWAVGRSVAKPLDIKGGQDRAILASDMHLGLRVPTVWYRALIDTPTKNHPRRRLVGVTLPGTPVLIEGSNGSVAWGFTNSTGDFGDLIELKMTNEQEYATPAGPRKLESFTEKLSFGSGEEEFTYRWSIWGPVVEERDGRIFVHRWIGNDPAAFDLNIFDMESANTVEELAACANRAGMPNQNVMMVDSQGNIGWTLSGRLPKRKGTPMFVAADWSEEEAWVGYYAPEEHPRVINPESGRLWTANNRIMGGDFLQAVGDGRFDPGARAKQIRDRLFEKEVLGEDDLLAIQLDDEARMMKVWQGWLVGLIDASPGVCSDAFAQFAKQDGLRASADSVSYRVVHEFRNQVFARVFGFDVSRRGGAQGKKSGLAARLGIDRNIAISYEDVAEELIEQRPEHWLPQEFESWDSLLKDAIEGTERELTKDGPLAEARWGKRNRAAIKHPLSMGLPALSSYLDMPAVELPGDSHLPRVQSPAGGASERLVVSPGFEEWGFYHQPGGASGHPLSPYYRAGFDDWAEGRASALLPDAAQNTMEIVPK